MLCIFSVGFECLIFSANLKKYGKKSINKMSGKTKQNNTNNRAFERCREVARPALSENQKMCGVCAFLGLSVATNL